MTSPSYVSAHHPLRLVLLVLAVACLVVFAGDGFGWWTLAHPDGFLGLGLAFGFASFI